MTSKTNSRVLRATSAACALALANAAPAQTQTETPPSPQAQGTPEPTPPPAAEEDVYGESGGEVVVTGVRRGTVIGDIPPENQLGPRDIRATGATDITELLDALAPQIGSARGRGGERPILLLNGQRISGFREVRDIPPEAIERLDILPEEVALKYGYRADQRVVNIALSLDDCPRRRKCSNRGRVSRRRCRRHSLQRHGRRAHDEQSSRGRQ